MPNQPTFTVALDDPVSPTQLTATFIRPVAPGPQPVPHIVDVTDSADGYMGSKTVVVPAAAPLAPAAPTGLKASSTWDATTGKPANTLTWSTSVGATSYDVLRNGSVIQTGITTPSYVDEGATPGGTVAYTVIARGPGGPSPASSPAAVTSASAPVAAHGVVLRADGTVTPFGITPGIEPQCPASFLCPGPAGMKFVQLLISAFRNFNGGPVPDGVIAQIVASAQDAGVFQSIMWFVEMVACDMTKSSFTAPGPGNGFVASIYAYLGEAYGTQLLSPNCQQVAGALPFAFNANTGKVLHMSWVTPRHFGDNQGPGDWVGFQLADRVGKWISNKFLLGDSMNTVDNVIANWQPDQFNLVLQKVVSTPGFDGADSTQTWTNNVLTTNWMDMDPNNQVIRGGEQNSGQYEKTFATDGLPFNAISASRPLLRKDLYYQRMGLQDSFAAFEDGIQQFRSGLLPVAQSMTLPSGYILPAFSVNQYHPALHELGNTGDAPTIMQLTNLAVIVEDVMPTGKVLGF